MITANGKVQTNEEAQVYVHDLDLFVTVQILDDTPAVLSSGKLFEEHGFSNEWASGQKPHLTKNGKIILCKTEEVVLVVVPGLTSKLQRKCAFYMVPVGLIEYLSESSKITTSLSGSRSSQIISKMQKCQHTQTLLMIQVRNVLRKCHQGSKVLKLTSPKDRSCEIFKR